MKEDIPNAMLRVVTGGFFVPHGGQKLLGWAGGSFEKTVGMMAKVGLPFPELMAALTGGIQLVAGFCLMVGLFTRASAFLCFCLLAVAFFVVFPRGFFWLQGGFEYTFMWAVLCLYFVIRGSNEYALGALFSLDKKSKWLG